MKNKDAKWSIERMHKVTEALFYLSPGGVNWISVADHQKYKTRYGRWTWSEAELIRDKAERENPDFFYCITSYEKVK